MTDTFEEDVPYTVGKPDVEGDQRRFYKNRPLAQQYANLGQQTWPDTVYSAGAQFEPNFGFVAVLHAYHNVPDAWAMGYEVAVPKAAPDKTPPDWASNPTGARTGPKAGTGGGTAPGTESAPVRGATARVWAIADEVGASSRADRGKVVAACVAEGINPSTAATQWSKYAKSKGW
jgi:hypothetical protein